MGAMADGFVAFAQPLLDQTDGSHEQMSKALTISQLCFNLALLPEDKRDASLSEMQPALQMDDEEFDEFRRAIVIPMIQRHHDMFPRMHQRASAVSLERDLSPWPEPKETAPAQAPAGIDRYAPCPCNSGEKYKFCCGKKRR